MKKAAERPDLTTMRREDRAKEDEWIREYLTNAPYGVMATVSEGQPFQNINPFVYDGDTHSIYIHTAGEGRLRTIAERGGRVSYCAGSMGRLLPSKRARGFSVEYESVIVFGTISLIDDPTFARAKLQLLLDKYFPHMKSGPDYRPITSEEVAEVSAYQIKIDAWSGKKKKVKDDYPGAFLFGSPPPAES